MSEPKKTKILVCADLKGKFDEIFSKVNELAKGPAGTFDLLFCIGRFFSPNGNEIEPYLKGEKKASVSTYFITTYEDFNHKSLERIQMGGPLCENITYLGKQGLQEIKGFHIAYISGMWSPKHPKGSKKSSQQQMIVDWREPDVAPLLKQLSDPQFKGADILLSNAWPQGVLNELGDTQYPAGISLLECENYGSDIVARVAVLATPRYHFARDKDHHIFFERPPYRNGPQFPREGRWPVTRFFSLADAFNTKKQRFLYAFNTVPLRQMLPLELYVEPPNTTPFPFEKFKFDRENARKYQKIEIEEETSKYDDDKLMSETSSNYGGYFYSVTASQSSQSQNNRNKREKRKENEKGKKSDDRGSGCWFCLSNPKVEKHLVISVADETYLALAKGPINEFHVLIIPIEHLSSTVSLPDNTLREVNAYKEALKQCFKGHCMIFFERNIPLKGKGPQHMHIQAIPVSINLLPQIKITFQKEAESIGFQLKEVDKSVPLKELVADVPYFYVETPDVNLLKVFAAENDAASDNEQKIPLQFGRRVIAKLLGCPEREDWRSCHQSQEVETQIVANFKQLFKPFDFSLQLSK